MPTIEVDELEVQQSKQMREWLENAAKHPKARKKLLEAQKLLNPKAEIPELDQPDPNIEALEALRKEQAELKKSIEADKSKRELDERLNGIKAVRDTGFAELRKQRYTDEGIKAIEKIMDEKGILDPLDAAAIFERNNPPPTPIVPGRSTNHWNFMDMPKDTDDKLKQLVALKGQNDDFVVDQMVQDALVDVRGQSQPLSLRR